MRCAPCCGTEPRLLRARFLSHCGLTELPVGMGSLRRLTKLWLTHNALRALPPDFGDLPALEWLWLNDNLFKTVRTFYARTLPSALASDRASCLH